MSSQPFNPGINLFFVFFFFFFNARLDLICQHSHIQQVVSQTECCLLSSNIHKANTKFWLIFIQENFTFKLDIDFKTMCEKILKLNCRQHCQNMRITRHYKEPLVKERQTLHAAGIEGPQRCTRGRCVPTEHITSLEAEGCV